MMKKPGKLTLQNDNTRIDRCKTMYLQSCYDVTKIMNNTTKTKSTSTINIRQMFTSAKSTLNDPSYRNKVQNALNA